eukprot:CAMPEP_0204913542 /NCGR_PEP_ID=MMETSP1397-20131031/11366_1 /ASSEMBLY_ACC=CAM_ASM_000891 /TAXON_ID=49980 /ORGANISM="Climacostomum Climacostomum virens, Strain Stock W-24" /LENGTH=183 /DNA_ID=CAMNT_0052084785 /DNA_START=15 /DNA_END=563 /DNA_ORIENTATION=-
MILKHVNVKHSPTRRTGKRVDPVLKMGVSSDTPSTFQRPNVAVTNRDMIFPSRNSSLPGRHDRYKNFSYQDFSFDSKTGNVDFHMLNPTQVLDVQYKGSVLVKQSPFYTNYKRMLNTPNGFHLHRDELTDITSKPQVQRQEVHALRILKESKRLNSPAFLKTQMIGVRKSDSSPVRSAFPSLR